MKHTEYFEFVEKTLADMTALIKKKNADYTNGGSAFANFEQAQEFGVDPLVGLSVRLGDKMQRLKSYCKQGSLQLESEGIEDIFKDFIGYSLIALGMLQTNQIKGDSNAKDTTRTILKTEESPITYDVAMPLSQYSCLRVNSEIR